MRISITAAICHSCAAAALQETSLDRESGGVEVQEGRHAPNLTDVEELRIDTVNPHSVPATGEGITLCVGMKQVQYTALANHRVVIEILLEALPQPHAQFVKGDVAGKQVIRANDRRVASHIAGANPTFLNDGHIMNAEFLGEIVSGGEPVTARSGSLAWLPAVAFEKLRYRCT